MIRDATEIAGQVEGRRAVGIAAQVDLDRDRGQSAASEHGRQAIGDGGGRGTGGPRHQRQNCCDQHSHATLTRVIALCCTRVVAH